MVQYISKSALVAEIEGLKRNTFTNFDEGVNAAAQILLDFLDTLEVKEEVLDENDKSKLMRKCVKAAYKRGYDMGVLQTTNKMNHNIKEVDLEKENLPISNSLTEEGLFTFEDGSQAIITKTN